MDRVQNPAAPPTDAESWYEVSDERGERRTATLPTWFVAGLAAAMVWWGTAGVGGLGLLLAGLYQPVVVILAASVAAALMAFATARSLGPRRALHGPAIIAVGIAVGFLVLAASFHSEHLLTDRDPAVYINTARSIARTHELHPHVRTGPFSDRHLYSTQAAGFNEKDRRLQPNFFPLLPVLLAVGWSIGGDHGLLVVPAVLAALGVLACYALASKVVGSRAALLAPLLLVVAPLQLWFARDAYSELIVQVLVIGGLWLYLEARPVTRPPSPQSPEH